MGIRVAHEPDVGLFAGAAYTAGQGERIERDLARLMEMRERQTQRQYDWLSEGRRLDYYRERDEQAAEQAAAERAHEAATLAQRMEADAHLQDVRLRAQQSMQERAAQAAHDQWQRDLITRQYSAYLDRSNVTWEYDERQRRELEKIDSGLAWLDQQVAEGTWTPEEAEQARQQLMAKRYGITPGLRISDTPPPNEILRQQLATDEEGNKYLYDPSKGTFERLDPPIPFKDFATIYQNVATSMQSQDPESGVVTAPDPKEVESRVQGMLQAYQTFMGQPTAQEQPGARQAAGEEAQGLTSLIAEGKEAGEVQVPEGFVDPMDPSQPLEKRHESLLMLKGKLPIKEILPAIAPVYIELAKAKLGPGASVEELKAEAKRLAAKDGWPFDSQAPKSMWKPGFGSEPPSKSSGGMGQMLRDAGAVGSSMFDSSRWPNLRTPYRR